jgi:hypothetical protein
MLLLSAAMKLAQPPAVIEGMAHLGFSAKQAFGLFFLEVACTLLYLIPRTSILGAILLTGYLGGATAAHVRVGDPFYATISLGVLVWLGLYLREPRLHPLLPLRNSVSNARN